MFEYSRSMENKPGLVESRRTKLLSFYRKNRRMPNMTEIMELFDVTSRSSAFYISEKFVEKGYAQKDRSGKLVPAPGLFAIPQVGRIRAGFAAPAEDELADTITIGDYLVRNPNSSFLLKVEGDSMRDAGIEEGDMVIFERTPDVKSGQIVVALTENGYTLKYLRSKGNTFYLEAANDAYPNIHPKEGQIIGKVVATFRTYP